MNIQINDASRAAIMEFVRSILPVAVLLGVGLTTDQMAIIMVAVGSTVTLLGFLIKTGAGGDPNTTVPIATANAAITEALNTPAPEQAVYTRADLDTLVSEALRQYEAART